MSKTVHPVPVSRRHLLIGALALGVLAARCGESVGSSVPGTAAATPASSEPLATPIPQPKAVATAAPGATRGPIIIAGPMEGEARTLQGAGATFPQVLYTKWFTEYEKITGVRVNYQGIGSGGGIKAITDRTVDFGATDSPMTDRQLQAVGAPILHIPATLGAVVPTYNVAEAGEGLKLTGEALAGIYLGEITKWNDPRLTADNPGLQSADREIVVIHRSDGSGTTYVWTDYLSAVSPTWDEKVGKGTSVDWPTGLGALGNPGVAGEVKQNPYSIGYVEFAYALQNRLGVAAVRNRAGNFVTPTLESTTAAAAAASIPADLRASIVDAPGPQAFPIASFSWILALEEMDSQPEALALTRLLWWAIHTGQQLSGDLHYAPLPENIVARCEEQIRKIKVDGQQAFPEA